MKSSGNNARLSLVIMTKCINCNFSIKVKSSEPNI